MGGVLGIASICRLRCPQSFLRYPFNAELVFLKALMRFPNSNGMIRFYLDGLGLLSS